MLAGQKTCKEAGKGKSHKDGEIIAALAKLREIFDYSCGGKLKPLS